MDRYEALMKLLSGGVIIKLRFLPWRGGYQGQVPDPEQVKALEMLLGREVDVGRDLYVTAMSYSTELFYRPAHEVIEELVRKLLGG